MKSLALAFVAILYCSSAYAQACTPAEKNAVQQCRNQCAAIDQSCMVQCVGKSCASQCGPAKQQCDTTCIQQHPKC